MLTEHTVSRKFNSLITSTSRTNWVSRISTLTVVHSRVSPTACGAEQTRTKNCRTRWRPPCTTRREQNGDYRATQYDSKVATKIYDTHKLTVVFVQTNCAMLCLYELKLYWSHSQIQDYTMGREHDRPSL